MLFPSHIEKKYICILTFALATSFLWPRDPPGGPNPRLGNPGLVVGIVLQIERSWVQDNYWPSQKVPKMFARWETGTQGITELWHQIIMDCTEIGMYTVCDNPLNTFQCSRTLWMTVCGRVSQCLTGSSRWCLVRGLPSCLEWSGSCNTPPLS